MITTTNDNQICIVNNYSIRIYYFKTHLPFTYYKLEFKTKKKMY